MNYSDGEKVQVVGRLIIA